MLLILKWLILIALVVAAAVFLFLNFHPVFGGKPDQAGLERIRNSPNFNGTEFVNIEQTVIATRDDNPSWLDWTIKMLNPPPGKRPAKPLPTVPLNVSELKHGSIAWLGHATTLMQMGGKRVITDPVFYRASPVPFTVEPFAMSHTPQIAELPALDAVLISHDHYDHLDYRAIRELNGKTARFIVPLGVKAHLQKWGVADEKITELDWDETAQLDDIAVTLVPSRHFSGRTMGGRNHTLWGGYVIKGAGLSLYFSGDSGYGTHYKERIARYAPFDLVLMESGAYDEGWSQIHSFPEQSVQAVLDLGANRTMPVHWGKFDLANHTWTDGINRFTKAAEENGITAATPKIGQVFNISDETLPQEKWWKAAE
ncbi:MAG: MBL fold metallo-hydrolase [Neisseria sp.]|nr:MBL fold metallo-hydrolase [Neisseria sp.]